MDTFLDINTHTHTHTHILIHKHTRRRHGVWGLGFSVSGLEFSSVYLSNRVKFRVGTDDMGFNVTVKHCEHYNGQGREADVVERLVQE